MLTLQQGGGSGRREEGCGGLTASWLSFLHAQKISEKNFYFYFSPLKMAHAPPRPARLQLERGRRFVVGRMWVAVFVVPAAPLPRCRLSFCCQARRIIAGFTRGRLCFQHSSCDWSRQQAQWRTCLLHSEKRRSPEIFLRYQVFFLKSFNYFPKTFFERSKMVKNI